MSWAPGGAEPANASTYSVTYLYNVATTQFTVTETAVTILAAAGGVSGQMAQIHYTSKLPRIDAMCLDRSGRPVVVKGIAARSGRVGPAIPDDLLKLADLHMTWFSGLPVVDNSGAPNITFAEQGRINRKLFDVYDQFDFVTAGLDIAGWEPVARKGTFTDLFTNDLQRDAGAAQTIALVDGEARLAIDDVLRQPLGNAVATLPYTEEVVVSQPWRTSSMLINPYMSWRVTPGAMKLEPASWFWTETTTAFTSDVTRQLTGPIADTQVFGEPTGVRRENREVIPALPMTITIDGFGAGETLATLTFAGLSIKPAGTQTANAQGRIVVAVTTPAGTPAGAVRVAATGNAGSFCGAIFHGSSTIDVLEMRRVTQVVSVPPPPPPPEIVIWTGGGGNSARSEPFSGFQGSAGAETAAYDDPLAQTIALTADRIILGVDFRMAAIGDRTKPVRVQLRTVVNGYPARTILAEALVPLATIVIGERVAARFTVPVAARAGVEYAFVLLTDDLDHAVSIARLGDVDSATQARVTTQPYVVGQLFSSANNSAWTAHPDADLCFDIVAAVFTATTRTVALWTGALDQVSDLMARATVELPTAAARMRFELVRASGQVIAFAGEQRLAFAEYISETVTLRAVLEGSETVSPILFPGGLLIGGRIRANGTYVSRAFPFGAGVTVRALLRTLIPAGATITVDLDDGSGTWTAMTLGPARALGNSVQEIEWTRTNFTAAQGRIRFTMTGGPAARPRARRLRAWSF